MERAHPTALSLNHTALTLKRTVKSVSKGEGVSRMLWRHPSRQPLRGSLRIRWRHES